MPRPEEWSPSLDGAERQEEKKQGEEGPQTGRDVGLSGDWKRTRAAEQRERDPYKGSRSFFPAENVCSVFLTLRFYALGYLFVFLSRTLNNVYFVFVCVCTVQ